MTEIQTARLLLRPWQPDDLAEFTRLLTDPVVTRYIVVHTPFSPEDMAELSERTLEQWDRNGFGPWAAIEKQTGRWVGRIGLNELPDWPGPTRSRWAGSCTRSSGVAGWRPRAAGPGCDTASRWSGWSGSSAPPWPPTQRRGGVMEKCGLRFQGELPMAGTVVAWYAIDRLDWQGLQYADQHTGRTSGPARAG